ncbi:MAG: hypothetical protein UV74_C0001G0087 [Candidatus Woesebacteria bacterium GW2011_GWB1_43_14]|uniref:Uncharacterized protein n=1 Tax=Candidatus Woesebacteria bacterium GW2011_GWB1_43_14 TaxID=1618578 RepID=A0A0G1DN28_9BACT|nr:MAG: hypothetical protein UV51_C0002G0076 [Candidatus Woesebacteria bacterium GW2011_GWC1_42_9]KKS98977.1 MAG: hypothetical protein UV74_C0001G0087 [Candidatus Woesebacteria bacterium GW2011_GWB1_43_14]
MPDIFVAKETKKESMKEVKDNLDNTKPDPVNDLKKSPKARHKLPGHTRSPLAAYNYCPTDVKFAVADKEEKVVLFLRRHPITNIPWILLASIMCLAPMVLTLFPPFGLLPSGYQAVVIMTWYLITLAFIIEQFLSWYFNVNIVTDERMFDVDFVNLVYREITDAHIDQIEDVTTVMGGVVRTMFNYGDVMIQTAGQVPRIEFLAVPKPDRVAQVLRELRVEEETEKLEGRVR